MMKHRTHTSRLLLPALFVVSVHAACSEENSDPSEPGDGVVSPYGGEGGRAPVEAMPGDGDMEGHGDAAGGQGGAREGDAQELPAITDEVGAVDLPPLAVPPSCGLGAAPYLLGGNVATSGYLKVQSDVTSAGGLGLGGASMAESAAFLEDATLLSGATSHAVFSDGTAYVSFWEKPIIEKWQVKGSGEIEKQGVLELARSGVTATASTRQLVQIRSSTKGYYVDPENNYVLGFNPSTMKSDGVLIDLTEGFGPASETMALGDVHRDGDHLVISARFWDEQFNVRPVIRAAFIDMTTDTVTFAEETRCGDVAWHATDSAGNLYLGSHYDNVAAQHVPEFGVSGTDSCIVRILRGERSFDQEYYVNLDELLDGIGTTLLDGPGDRAYVMKYAGDPISVDNWDEVVSGATWELWAITLGNEANELTRVDVGGAKFNPTPTLFCADENQAILGLSGAGFVRGQLFAIEQDDTVTPALTYPGALGRGAALE